MAVYVVAADVVISVSLLIQRFSSSHPHLPEHQERQCGRVSSQGVWVTFQRSPNETVVAKSTPFAFILVWFGLSFQETSPVILVAGPAS